ncbi:MAG TPA: M48 family metallopeptidase, partial [Gemmataceae bacterium]|nr:M48 family metallopeptidase [Gemmataceae bacterium]
MKIPYPPSPENVPDDLTALPETYRRQQSLLLGGLFVFLMFYIGLCVLFGMVAVWCVLTVAKYAALKIVGAVFAGIVFLFLVKGFFKRPQMNKEMHLEITEDEHPVLFGFIDRICDELGAPRPNKVYVSPDVNAAVMPRSTLVNLFVEPKKDLLIGLGLVNCINLSEFKSVLAHEFGHFSQSGFTSSYGYVASKIIIDLVEGEDWFDRTVDWCKEQQGVFGAFGYTVGGMLWVGRKVLEALLQAITLQRLAVMRESEFHADLLAVKAAGSDAVALSLFRMRFGNVCLGQAIGDLAMAADHKLYTRDVFLHQDRAEAIVRRKRKNPAMGIPPAHEHPMSGKSLRIFDPDEESPEDDVPEMRRTHPPAHELEASAKKTYIPAVVDHRSPWVLFSNPEELKERMTYKMYRMMFKVPKNTELTDAETVQQYIDNEHADTTYDQKYQGVYDDRKLEPGNTDELNELLQESPWAEDRMEKVFAKLYDGCKERAEEFAATQKDLSALRESVVGRPSPKVKRSIKDLEDKLDRQWEWFKSFDRRVYLLHIQMAAQVDPALRQDLADRYFFQLEVQRMYMAAQNAFNEADMYIGVLIRMKQLPPDFFAEVMQVLRDSWKTLKKIVQDAREVNFPAMKNFEEGERLADFILEDKLVPEPPTRFIKGEWVDKLMTQLQRVRNRCFRLHFKSIGGILAVQEKISAAWKDRHVPVAAELVSAEPAEVFVARVVTADVVDAAEVLAEEVVEVAEPVHVPEVVEAAVIAPPGSMLVAEVVNGEVQGAEEVLAAVVIDDAPPPVPPPVAPEPVESVQSLASVMAPPAPAPAPRVESVHSLLGVPEPAPTPEP